MSHCRLLQTASISCYTIVIACCMLSSCSSSLLVWRSFGRYRSCLSTSAALVADGRGSDWGGPRAWSAAWKRSFRDITAAVGKFGVIWVHRTWGRSVSSRCVQAPNSAGPPSLQPPLRSLLVCPKTWNLYPASTTTQYQITRARFLVPYRSAPATQRHSRQRLAKRTWRPGHPAEKPFEDKSDSGQVA